MKKQLQKNKFTWHCWFESFFHLSLFFMLFDWACPMPYLEGTFGAYEFALLGTGICLFGCLKKENFRFIKHIGSVLVSAKWLVGCFVAYVVYGFITLFYGGNFSFGSYRYIVVLQMILFSFYMFYYLSPREESNSLKQLKKIATNLSFVSMVIALVSLVGYFTQWYTVYYQRISPIRDYNQYTTILLMGTIAFSAMIINMRPLAFWKRYTALGAYWCVISVAVICAGSRRSQILLCVLGMIFAVYALYMQGKYHRKRHNHGVSLGVTIVSLSLCFALCSGISSFVFNVVGELAPARLEKALALMETEEADSNVMESVILSGEQYELTDSFKGLTNGKGFSSREAIWKAAYKKIKSSDTKHLLFGYGAPYSWELYDDLSNPLVIPVREYYRLEDDKTLWMNPHNFLLQDALDGGLLFVAIEITLLISLFISFLKLLYRTPHTALPLIMMNGVLYVTLMISSGTGMVAHKFLWLLMVFQIMEIYRMVKKKEMVS